MRWGMAAGQGAGLLLALCAAALAPPARGTMLLLPLVPGAERALVPLALAAGARLVAPGGAAGSIVVDGSLGRLAWPMLRAGILIAGAQAPCGRRAA